MNTRIKETAKQRRARQSEQLVTALERMYELAGKAEPTLMYMSNEFASKTFTAINLAKALGE